MVEKNHFRDVFARIIAHATRVQQRLAAYPRIVASTENVKGNRGQLEQKYELDSLVILNSLLCLNFIEACIAESIRGLLDLLQHVQ